MENLDQERIELEEEKKAITPGVIIADKTKEAIAKVNDLKLKHESKIEEVKDSLMNKDWLVQGYFQKAVIVLGFFLLLTHTVRLLFMWKW